MTAQRPSFIRSATGIAERIARAIAVVCTLLLMLVTGADVFLRTFAGRGIPGAVEITEVVLVIAVFLGMMTASIDGMHIRATLVTGALRPTPRRHVRVVGSLIAIATTGWLLYGALLRAIASVTSGEYRFGLVQVPIWPARVAIVVGLFGLLVALILHTIEVARGDPDGIVSDEEAQTWKL